MPIRWLTAMLDVPDDRYEPGCHFWEEATAMRAAGARDREGRTILMPDTGDAYLAVRRVSSEAGGCHLVLHVDDVDRVAQRAVGLGARAQRPGPCGTWMRSPAGLLFAIATWAGQSHRPAPVSWPTGQRSLVDQVCIDIPPAAFTVECDFWAQVSGSEHVGGAGPEFRYLPRATGMPLRLLLQRLDGAAAGAAQSHLDLACDDRPAEVRRHEALGAAVAHHGPVWTTFRDPAAIAYCITDRDPVTGSLAPSCP